MPDLFEKFGVREERPGYLKYTYVKKLWLIKKREMKRKTQTSV